jgi:hypothetical protein
MVRVSFPDWVKVGAKFRDETGEKEFHDVYHVRGLVDEVVVVRLWRREKRRWQYECLSRSFFEVRKNNLKLLK